MMKPFKVMRFYGLVAGAAASLWAQAPLVTADGFAVPRPGKVFSFPRDHGSHPEFKLEWWYVTGHLFKDCLLYTSPSPRDRQKSRMPSSA